MIENIEGVGLEILAALRTAGA
ncbi:MAG TPA: hypothetical protein VII63_04220 [Caulobacteraceae bacterium]